MEIDEYLEQIGQNAVKAKYEIQKLSEKNKNEALIAIAKAFRQNADFIISQNSKDLENGKLKGMHEGLLDRLMLNKARIDGMAEGLEQVAKLPDPNGKLLDKFTRPNGLVISKVAVPIGVIGIIFESRPNVTADAFALCFKAGNVTILKGGSDAICSNMAITKIIRQTLEEKGISEDAISLIEYTDRSVVNKLIKLNNYIDLMIPRGSAGLIRTVVDNSLIPVIETGTGNCHIYVDEFADISKAIPIIFNAKTQRIGVCNAAESLVVHEKIREKLLPLLTLKLKEKNVEMRADNASIGFIDGGVPATDEDFGKEYLDYILSVKTVGSIDEAIAHINKYNTGHSESIITENKENAQKFLDEVDAACVYVNASTRFTDGFEFGFGAEIGISTQKIHARGPMGLNELMSYKYKIVGDGQIR